MSDGAELPCYPWAPATWALAVWGVLTAGMSWFFPGAHPVSQVLHAGFGLVLLGYALWRVWSPRIVLGPRELVERPGTSSARTLPLDDVAGLVALPATGHAPSERDLERQLGLRLHSGGYRWIDLRWLRARDRTELRRRIVADPVAA